MGGAGGAFGAGQDKLEGQHVLAMPNMETMH